MVAVPIYALLPVVVVVRCTCVTAQIICSYIQTKRAVYLKIFQKLTAVVDLFVKLQTVASPKSVYVMESKIVYLMTTNRIVFPKVTR